MKSFARFIAYIPALSIGGVIGAFCLFILVAALYYDPHRVIDSYECARGTVISLGALLGGAICGAGLGCHAMSKVLYQGDLRPGELDLTEMESRDSFARILRNATHQTCSGGIMVGFSAFNIDWGFVLTFFFGLMFTLIGFGRFIRAHFVRPQSEIRRANSNVPSECLIGGLWVEGTLTIETTRVGSYCDSEFSPEKGLDSHPRLKRKVV